MAKVKMADYQVFIKISVRVHDMNVNGIKSKNNYVICFSAR